MKRRLITTTIVAALGVLCLSVASPAATNASMTGETLSGGIGSSSPTNLYCDFPGVNDVPPSQQNYTWRFQVGGDSAIAAGPYPGHFSEQATIAVVNGMVTSFSANFTIVSGDTTITGTKQLAPVGGTGSCTYGPPFSISADLTASYQAQIQTPTGTTTDSGTSSVHAQEITGVSSRFTEDFTSTAGPGSVTLSPVAATNNVGTNHTVTATVTNTAGAPSQNTPVIFRVIGADTVSGSCTTDPIGQCSFTYSGPQLPGADAITACADSNANSSCDAGEPVGEATKAWIYPTSTAGQTTGGGQIDNAAGDAKIAFGFTAKSDANGLKGECTVVDISPATNIKVKCLDVTTLVQSGTHSFFAGHATVNGVATDYRIDVDDLAEPGKGRDTFKIQTSSGYTVGGVLTNGNIQVHN
jgi:hypothetical protein